MRRPLPLRGVWPIPGPDGRQAYELRRADGSKLFEEPFVLAPEVEDPFPYTKLLWDILDRLDPPPKDAAQPVVALVR